MRFRTLKNLEEFGKLTDVLDYFEKICNIPRSTGKEDKIREFIKKEAEKLGFQTIIDEIKNIAVIILSTNNSLKKRTKIILQSHMDMVCIKDENVEHDFSKDPIKLHLYEIENEKWITAEGTTLGADNGIGIAFQLALMKNIYDKKLNFDSIDFVLLFTVCEELGGDGAIFINKTLLEGDYLINLDSEIDDTFTVGSAASLLYRVGIKMKRIALAEQNQLLIPIKITVDGLIGGHSGVEIHKGRPSAIKILAQLLWKLNKKYRIHLNSLKGGTWESAIPKSSETIVFIKNECYSEIKTFINDFCSDNQRHFDGIEENINITIEMLKDFTDYTHFSNDYQNKILNILHLIPYGPYDFHSKKRELVHSSNNLGPIRSMRSRFEFGMFCRSFSQFGLDSVYEKVISLLDLSGLKYKFYNFQTGPEWTPNFNSIISNIARKTYKDIFGDDVKIEAIHGGLECADFIKHNPELELISMGPSILGAHTTEERLKVSSILKMWKFLIAFLERLA